MPTPATPPIQPVQRRRRPNARTEPSPTIYSLLKPSPSLSTAPLPNPHTNQLILLSLTDLNQQSCTPVLNQPVLSMVSMRHPGAEEA